MEIAGLEATEHEDDDPTPGAVTSHAAPAAGEYDSSGHLVEVIDRRIIPSVGRMVHYQLTSYDCNGIRDLRKNLAVRSDAKALGGFTTVPADAGNSYEEGDIVAAVIVRTWGPTADSAVNLQLLLDGTDSFWKTSVSQSTHLDGAPEFGRWSVPPRV